MDSTTSNNTVDRGYDNAMGRGDPLDLINSDDSSPVSLKNNTGSLKKPPSLESNTGSIEMLDSKPAMMGFLFGFSCFILILAVVVAVREAKKRRMIRQYLDNADGFVARRSVMGGWHGEYKWKQRGGSGSASSTQSDSDGCSRSSGSEPNQNTIVFSGLGLGPGFSGSAPDDRIEMELNEITLMFEAGKRSEMQLADRNIYLLDGSSSSLDLDDDCGDDDLFASVRYGGSESMGNDGEGSVPGDELL